MAGIKAGTAYIDIKMVNLGPLKSQIASQVTSAATNAGNKASKALTSSISGKTAAQRVATDLTSGLAGIGAAVARPFTQSFSQVASSGAVTAARSFATGFSQNLGALLQTGSLKGFGAELATLGRTTGVQFATSVGSGLKNLPGIVGTAFSGAFSSTLQTARGIAGTLALIPSALVSAGTAMTSFSRQIGMAAYQAKNLGLLMSVAFTAPVAVVGILGAAIGVKFASQIEDATIGLKALLPAGYDVAALVARLQKMAIASPVFDSASVITFTQRMVASGLEIKKVERFLSAFGNIAVTVGIPMDKVNLALEAFAQMAGKGVVNMEELRQQLGDALPGALKIAADGLGVTQAKLFEMVKQGEVTADELLSAFIKVGESSTYVSGAANGADTLRSRWNQLVESVQSKLANAVLSNMDQVKSALASAGPWVDRLVNAFGKALPSALDWFGQIAQLIDKVIGKYESLSDKNKDLVKTIAGIAIVAGPIILALGAFGTAVAGIAAGFGVLLSPVGLTIVAILAVGAAAYAAYKWFGDLWNSSEKLRNTVMQIVSAFTDYLLPTFKKIANEIKGSLVDAWENISREITKNKGNFEAFKTLLQAVGVVALALVGVFVGVATGIARAIGPIITAIGSLITGVIQIVTGFVNFFYHLFSGNFAALDADLRTIWNGLWDAIVGTVFNLGKAIWGFISGFVEGIVGFFEGMYDALVGHSIVPDLINGIVRWFLSLPGKILGVISGFVSSIISKFSEIGGNVINIISNLISGIGSWFSSLPGRIAGALGNLAGLLYNAGRDVIRGLMNGIENAAGALYDKAKGIADTIKNTINKALDIGSPSRVMAKTGKWIVQGLIVGIDNDIADLKSSMTASVDAITSGLARIGVESIVNVGTADPKRSASLYIENYTAPSDASPEKQAESWAWLNNTRGW